MEIEIWEKMEQSNLNTLIVPVWMKKNSETYFRVELYGGERLNTISPLCTAAVEKDVNAFSRLMEHIRETDENSAVIMVQVENEVGLLGTERDYCAQAEEVFGGSVPEMLLPEQTEKERAT